MMYLSGDGERITTAKHIWLNHFIFCRSRLSLLLDGAAELTEKTAEGYMSSYRKNQVELNAPSAKMRLCHFAVSLD
jgi:hypothetical protein